MRSWKIVHGNLIATVSLNNFIKKMARVLNRQPLNLHLFQIDFLVKRSRVSGKSFFNFQTFCEIY